MSGLFVDASILRREKKKVIFIAMASSDVLRQHTEVKIQVQSGYPNPIASRSRLFIIISVVALFVLACWMRWHTLDVPLDRDYDEGVYWQSLRLLAEGHTLYKQIFYSQPPAFLLSIFPAYLVLGQSILAARIGIALLSLLGLSGALLAGKVLRGNVGVLAALLLLLANAFYLTESQTLQADAPSAALMLLALGLAYLWWQYPTGLAGYCLAIVTTVTLALSLLSKLFGFADFVPIGLLAAAHLWRTWQQPPEKRLAYSGSLLAGIVALVLTCLLFIVPFRASFSQLWDQVITFHNAAKAHSPSSMMGNVGTISHVLLTPLGVLALYGMIVSLLRKDWRVLPLIAWLLTILYLLWQQVPLFQHHLVTLTPPLVLLAMMGVGPFPFSDTFRAKRSHIWVYLGDKLIFIGVCVTVIFGVVQIWGDYQSVQQNVSSSTVRIGFQVAHDLDVVTQPDQWVITDEQFLVAQADRSTPPQLVDTSSVHIQSGYLLNAQLIQIAEQPRVHAVLFYTNRLRHVQGFYLWVSQHFHMVHDYGKGRTLWTKIGE